MKPADGSLPSKSYFGTGDIEAPKPRGSGGIDPEHEREKFLPKPWESWADINEKASQASREKKEWLAERLAEGKLRTKGELKAAAKYLGCDEREIHRQKLTSAMQARVAEMLKALAAYHVAEAMPYQAELAKTDVASFDKLARIGDVLKSQGVQINTLNDNRRNGGDDEGDRQFFQKFHERAQGRLAIVEGTNGRGESDTEEAVQYPDTVSEAGRDVE